MAKTIWTSPSTLCIGDNILVENIWEQIQQIETPSSGLEYILYTPSRMIAVPADKMVEIF